MGDTVQSQEHFGRWPVDLGGALAGRVKARREELDLTQMELAVAVGVSREHINRVEMGHNRTPHTLARLAEALGVEPMWLTTGLPCYAKHQSQNAVTFMDWLARAPAAGMATAGNLPDEFVRLDEEPVDDHRKRLAHVLYFALGFVIGALSSYGVLSTVAA